MTALRNLLLVGLLAVSVGRWLRSIGQHYTATDYSWPNGVGSHRLRYPSDPRCRLAGSPVHECGNALDEPLAPGEVCWTEQWCACLDGEDVR